MLNPLRVLCVLGGLDRGGDDTMLKNFCQMDRISVMIDFVSLGAAIAKWCEHFIMPAQLGRNLQERQSFLLTNDIIM